MTGATYTGPDAVATDGAAIDFCDDRSLPIFASKCALPAVCHGPGNPDPADGPADRRRRRESQATAIEPRRAGRRTPGTVARRPSRRAVSSSASTCRSSTPTAPGRQLADVQDPARGSRRACSSDAGHPHATRARRGVERPTGTPARRAPESDASALRRRARDPRRTTSRAARCPTRADPARRSTSATAPLTGDELDTVSPWIAQGASFATRGLRAVGAREPTRAWARGVNACPCRAETSMRG